MAFQLFRTAEKTFSGRERLFFFIAVTCAVDTTSHKRVFR